MSEAKPIYHGYRFPSEIISHGVWLYYRFSLSFREVEDLLAERGIEVSYETVRQWCGKFGPDYAAKLKRRRGRLGDIWHLGASRRRLAHSAGESPARARVRSPVA